MTLDVVPGLGHEVDARVPSILVERLKTGWLNNKGIDMTGALRASPSASCTHGSASTAGLRPQSTWNSASGSRNWAAALPASAAVGAGAGIRDRFRRRCRDAVGQGAAAFDEIGQLGRDRLKTARACAARSWTGYGGTCTATDRAGFWRAGSGLAGPPVFVERGPNGPAIRFVRSYPS